MSRPAAADTIRGRPRDRAARAAEGARPPAAAEGAAGARRARRAADEPRARGSASRVDPGHLHFHVRMLQRAGLIELADGGGTREAVPPGREALQGRPGDPRRRASRASCRRAQLRELQRGFDLFAADGEFRERAGAREARPRDGARAAQRAVDKLNELEDESKPPLSITVAFHPLIKQGETTETRGATGGTGGRLGRQPGQVRCRAAARAPAARAPCRRRRCPRDSRRASRTTRRPTRQPRV